MKFTITSLLLVFTSISFGQGFNKLVIEKSNVDQNNSVYTIGKKFTYDVEIYCNGKKHYFNPMQNELSLDSTNHTQISLTVVKPRLFSRTNKNQTEIIYSYSSFPHSASTTGLVENEINIWVHPPRQGFLKSLELCPFPYVRINKSNDIEWNEEMQISDYWSNPNWGEWQGNLTVNYNYKLEGAKIISSNLGEIECSKIISTASSDIGVSTLESYYSPEYGFVRMNYTLPNNDQIKFELNSITNGEVFRSLKSFLKNK